MVDGRKERYPYSSLTHSSRPLEIGDLIWGRFKVHWWPAILLQKVNVGTIEIYNIFWFGDHKTSKVKINKLVPFIENTILLKQRITNNVWKNSIVEAGKEYGFETFYEFQNWIGNDFKPKKIRDRKIPQWIGNIANIQLRNTTNFQKIPIVRIERSREVEEFINLMKKPKRMCTSSLDFNPEYQHLHYSKRICHPCKIKTDYSLALMRKCSSKTCCAMCGSTRLHYLCGYGKCGKTYCKACIRTLLENTIRTEKHEISCPYCKQCCIIDVQNGTLSEPDQSNISIAYPLIEKRHAIPNQPLRILALGDVLACGLYAFDMLNIRIEVYNIFNYGPKNENENIKYFSDERIRYENKTITLETILSLGRIDIMLVGADFTSFVDTSKMANTKENPFCIGFCILDIFRIVTSLARQNRQLYWMVPANKHNILKHEDYMQLMTKYFQYKPISKENFLVWSNFPYLRPKLVNEIQFRKSSRPRDAKPEEFCGYPERLFSNLTEEDKQKLMKQILPLQFYTQELMFLMQ